MPAGAPGVWTRETVITIVLAPNGRGSRKPWRRRQNSCWGPVLAASKEYGPSDRCFPGAGREGEKLVGQTGWHPGRRRYRCNGRTDQQAVTISPLSNEWQSRRRYCATQTAEARRNQI